MTSATVTQLGDMLIGMNNNLGGMEMKNGEFAGIFQTASEKTEETMKQEMPVAKTSVTEKNVSISKKAEELNGGQTDTKVEEPKDMDAIEDELKAVAQELKEEIADKLDVSVEELEQVMETLGLTDASLFTQEGMATLVMEIEQISTPVELLTNAEVYQDLQELNAFAGELLENVKNEFQLTDAQMDEILGKLEMDERIFNETNQDETSALEADSDVEVTDVKNTEVNTENVNETTLLDENIIIKESTEVNGNENKAGNNGNEQQNGQNSQAASESMFQQNNTQTVNQAITEANQNFESNNVTTQEIYDQIGEYIKTNIKPGISEVEMQLNPENLGTLHIHLSSKQGNVTAQLTVQNELVKAALEVQLIQLKENFAEQGIKVDAVEVTVESHAFNQNMQQSNEENGQAQAEAKKTSTRSINLNAGWTEDELTEEEQLVAEMMEADGNTVDYKA